MKNVSFAWVAPAALLALSGLATLSACDVVDNPQPERIILSAGRRDTLALDSAEAAQPATAVTQKVLIEDFTGQQCGNCPRAASVGKSLQNAYPGRVFVTEVHVTESFAKPKLPHFPLDLRVPVVNLEIEQAFDLNNRGLPQGAVNRTRFNNNDSIPVGTDALWSSMVAAVLANAPQVDLRATALFDAATRTVRMKLNTKYLVGLSTGELRYNIILVEDSVEGAQKDYRLNRTQSPEQTVEKYDHHDVMRAALAGTFGTPQVTNPTAGQQFATYFRYQLPATSGWNERHCAIIAYISHARTRQILQVAKAKIM